jgi:hypothetical protein
MTVDPRCAGIGGPPGRGGDDGEHTHSPRVRGIDHVVGLRPVVVAGKLVDARPGDADPNGVDAHRLHLVQRSVDLGRRREVQIGVGNADRRVRLVDRGHLRNVHRHRPQTGQQRRRADRRDRDGRHSSDQDSHEGRPKPLNIRLPQDMSSFRRSHWITPPPDVASLLDGLFPLKPGPNHTYVTEHGFELRVCLEIESTSRIFQTPDRSSSKVSIGSSKLPQKHR